MTLAPPAVLRPGDRVSVGVAVWRNLHTDYTPPPHHLQSRLP
jgi:hypothetical protein